MEMQPCLQIGKTPPRDVEVPPRDVQVPPLDLGDPPPRDVEVPHKHTHIIPEMDAINRTVRAKGPAAVPFLKHILEEDSENETLRYRAMGWLVSLSGYPEVDGEVIGKTLKKSRKFDAIPKIEFAAPGCHDSPCSSRSPPKVSPMVWLSYSSLQATRDQP